MIHVLPDEESLAIACAEYIAQVLRDVLEHKERASFVLTGGGTPEKMYRVLAERHRTDVPWGHIDFFWGDERFVPPGHEESNFRMAQDALLKQLHGAACNVFPFPTTLESAEQAAAAYEQTLRSYFAGDDARFDLVLLGLGEDGHVASLFPGSEELDERQRWAVTSEAPEEMPVRERVTMTLPLLNAGARTIFLVAGEAKAEAVARTLQGGDVPAARIRPRGELVWYLDQAAAEDLEL